MKASYQTLSFPFTVYHLKNYTLLPHLHNQIEIIFVLSGSCYINIDHNTYNVTSEDFILIFPYQVHSFSQVNNCELIVQVFDPNLTPELIQHIGQFIPSTPIFKDLPTDCIDALLKAEHYYLVKADTHIIHAYVALYMSFLYQKLNLVPIKLSDYHSVLHTILLYINAHYTEKLTLNLLAEQLHISKYYISKIFSNQLHTSFTDYVNQLRLDYAINLLHHTDFPIRDIAFECGFDCERTFFRVFKKHMGMTPVQFRKNSCFSDITYSV